MSDRHHLVIGKFYPPHRGHHLLIDRAADGCDRLSVIVMAADIESIPLADRVGWLAAEHAHDRRVTVIGVTDNYPVDYADETAWARHTAVIVSALARSAIERARSASSAAVDVVASSEEYGVELARRLGAGHLEVDLERATVPVSGTACRADIPGHWDDLGAATRAGLGARIVVLGAESTGTTTVSCDIAHALAARGGVWARTQWVPEWGRDYTLGQLAATRAILRRDVSMDDLEWTREDFTSIADAQTRMENAAAAISSPVTVCDTDAFATGMWSERYCGERREDLESIAVRPRRAYVLTDHVGVPFEQDGIRDGEHLRAWMTGLFAARLDAAGVPWTLAHGTPAERLAQGLALVDSLTTHAWAFAEPLG